MSRFPISIIEGGPGSGHHGHGGLKGVWGGSSPGTGKHGVGKTMDHGAVQKRMRGLSTAELEYIRKDAGEASKAMPDGRNAGFYRDTELYAAAELKRRAEGEKPRVRGGSSIRKKSSDSLEYILKDSIDAIAAMPDSRKSLKYAKEALAAALELQRRSDSVRKEKMVRDSGYDAFLRRVLRASVDDSDRMLPNVLKELVPEFTRALGSKTPHKSTYFGLIISLEEFIKLKSKGRS